MNPSTKTRVLTAVLFCGLGLWWVPPASGQGYPTGHLQLVDQSWYELSPRERSRALENYRRFQKLPPEKKRDMEERYNQWQQLPTEERERLRRNYRRYRGMDSDEKEDFSRKYKHWRSRPRD